MAKCSHHVVDLEDSHQRIIRNVRISVTDRCNLRCTYCMPEEGVDWVPRSQILTFDELLRLVSIFHSFGVDKFRLTGGEPTIRSNFVQLVQSLQSICPSIRLSMTTNGLKLYEIAEDLQKAGMRKLNISLDTLDPQKYHDITLRDEFDSVIRGIKKAQSLDFEEIKINAVALKGFNIEEIFDFIKFSDESGLEVRFIEFMPFSGNKWKVENYISKKEILNLIKQEYKVTEIPREDKSKTSVTYQIEGTKARIGFIASVSESFCKFCNRLRITTEGNVRTCLHSSHEIQLHDLIRNGASDEEIISAIQSGVKEKWEGHPDFRIIDYKPPVDDKSMILIGG